MRSLTIRLIAGVLLAGSPVLPLRSDEAAAHQRHVTPLLHLENNFQLASKVQDIGWRLATGNAAFCDKTLPTVGLQLDDMASYGNPEAMRASMMLKGDFAVFGSAKGSPAAKANLTHGLELSRINGVDLDSWLAGARRDWRRVERIHDWIDRQLVDEGRLIVTTASGWSMTLQPVSACQSRFEVGGTGEVALADGTRVRISADHPAFAFRQDELAAVIAHELAHNILHHREYLEREGRTQKRVRLTEREADRLSPWLLANAGFAPDAALRFMQRWGPEHASGLFRKRTHEGWDERAEHIAAEIPRVLKALDEDGHADWKSRFEREITLRSPPHTSN